MRLAWVICAGVVVLLLSPMTGLALDPDRELDQYVRRTWDQSSGLPQASVTALVQDRQGYLWVGTFGGLARFDGVRFETFRTADHPGLSGNRIISLAEDRDGKLWIGTEASGASIYSEGRFSRFEPSDGLPLGLVGAFRQGLGDNFWIACEGGLLRVNGDRSIRFTPEDGLDGGEVTAVLETPQGLWVGTKAGLFRRHGEAFRPAAPHIFSGTRIGTILSTKDGGLWVGGEAGLFEVGDDGVALGISDRDLAPGRAIEDRDGNIWFPAESLWRLSRPVGRETLRTAFLAMGGARVVFEDREGSLWVGTNTEGLVQLRNGAAVSYPLYDRPVSAVPIIEDGSGGLWVGLPCVSLVHFTRTGITMYGEDSGLKSPCVWSLLRDRSGQLWVGSFGGGVFSFDGEMFTRIPGPGFEVRALWQDRDGTLYAGTEDGLYRFSASGFAAQPISGTEGYEIQFINQVDDAWWLGTTAGLQVVSPDRVVSWTTAEGLSNNSVRAVHLDERGVAWVGTYGGGLNRLEDGKVTVFGRAQGFPDDVVSRIIEDHNRRLWMTSNHGVFNVPRRQLDEVAAGSRLTLDVEIFGVGDGMRTAECNGGGQPAGLLTQDGKLWVPTIEGIAVIDTNDRAENAVPPPVFVEKVVVDGEAVEAGGGVLHLPPSSRNLEIHYTALSFVDSGQVRFRYQLTGIDRDWVDVGNRRIAYYAFLPPGDHDFRVRAFNADGVPSAGDAVLTIHLAPPFHQTWWFRGLGAVLLVLAGLAIAWIRIRRLRSHERRLAELVAVRTAELKVVLELTRKVNAGLVLEDVLDALYESFKTIIPYNRIGFSVLSEDGATVRALWARSDGEITGITLGYELRMDETSLGEVMLSGRPRILNDLSRYLEEHPDSASTRDIVAEGMQASLTIPLNVMDTPVGFLFFSSRRPRAYEYAHTKVFEQIAATLSQIVVKSRLYGELLETRHQLEEVNRELQALANLDGLTGIPNRRSFDLQLDREWRRGIRSAASLSILMIDIDHFKDFNDLHGHQSGDSCLQEVAKILQTGLRRAGDFTARYGGEEFVVILPETNAPELERIAEQLRNSVEQVRFPHPETNAELRVTISIGGSTTIPAADRSGSNLVAAADHALYQAKNAGRNWCLFARVNGDG